LRGKRLFCLSRASALKGTPHAPNAHEIVPPALYLLFTSLHRPFECNQSLSTASWQK